MKLTGLLFCLFLSFFVQAQDIYLPKPTRHGGKPLMQALNERQSAREFQEKELSRQQLSNLLWAAWGFNRDDRRTAPSSRNRQEMQVYVALSSGLYLYDAKENLLKQLLKEDIRKQTGGQSYVAKAPVNLIYVANYAANEKMNKENYATTSAINTGFIAQNVYLYCSSTGLSTVVRGYYDPQKLSTAMNLPEENLITLTQSIGYPKL